MGLCVTPLRHDGGVVESQSVQFGELARAVSNRARSLELVAPVFKSPPKVVGATRTVRWRRDGRGVVAVAFRNRPLPAVVSDLIEGVLVINRLDGVDLCRARDDMWESFADSVKLAA